MNTIKTKKGFNWPVFELEKSFWSFLSHTQTHFKKRNQGWRRLHQKTTVQRRLCALCRHFRTSDCRCLSCAKPLQVQAWRPLLQRHPHRYPTALLPTAWCVCVCVCVYSRYIWMPVQVQTTAPSNVTEVRMRISKAAVSRRDRKRHRVL